MKPMLQAELAVLGEEFCILASCFLCPKRKNSELEILRVKRLEVIHGRDP